MKSLLNLTRTLLCAGLAAAAWAQPAAATPLALAKSFEGNINVAGTQASLQSKAGGAKVCDLNTSARAGISLPDKASIVSATLYWAGTGSLDAEVLLDDVAVAADAGRRYASSLDGFTYFAAAADVTKLVANKTSFVFGGLKVDVSDTYCAKQQKENSMVAGFALVVVYAAASEPYRTVNLYEGLHAVRYGSVTVPMPDYAPAAGTDAAGRFGYIVWEGDKSGGQKNDHVRFNGETLRAEPFIQKHDAFNAKSGANSDETSLGIDFDFVDLPTLPAKAADASAVFTTESDRVLLGTAILAVPSKRADLAIRKTQSGEFRPDGEISYTLEVSNLGGRGDGKVEVRDTLPAALSYVSYSGADWRCTLSGQTVTCGYGKALAPGAKASVQITARITGEGRIVNTAEVSGTGDGVPGNNSSTVEGDAGTRPTGAKSFVFTVGACQAGETIKPSGASGCARFKGPVTAGSKPTIHLTHAVGDTATALDPAKDASPALGFSLVCNNPASSAGTEASYAGVGLGACLDEGRVDAGGGGGKPAVLAFPKGTTSVAAQFHYPDVGIVSLRAHDAKGVVATTIFASVPAELGVTYLRADGVPNPGAPALADGGFAEAGEPFLAAVSAYGLDGVGPLPNFGRETGEYAPAKQLGILAQGGAAEEDLLVAQDEWQANGRKQAQRTFVWNEAGMASLAVRLDNYLGTGRDFGTDAQAVGRFYPHYFATVTAGGFACLPRMSCPPEAGQSITRAVYSKQKFKASVLAYGRNGVLRRFLAPAMPPISLRAVSAPGHDGKLLDGFVNGGPLAQAERDLIYRLPNGYARDGGRDWTPPTAVYVRATAPELRRTKDGAQAVEISSLRADRASASIEGGIMVVNGRLMVGNVIGTPMAKTPVPLRAQYWSGAAWEQNGGVDDAEPVSGTVEFEGCRRSLRLSSASDACLAIVRVDGSASGEDTVLLPMLKAGRASLVLAPVGERSGTVDLYLDPEGEDEYLPSTIGRVSFGQFKSPVIYIREGY